MPDFFEQFGLPKSSEDNERPEARSWRELKIRTGAAYLRVKVVRNRQGLLDLSPWITVTFHNILGNKLHEDSLTWEQDLDLWLIRNEQARALNIENEKLRFSLHLASYLRPVVHRLGDGYFNSAIIDLLKASELSMRREVRKVMHDIHRNPLNGPEKSVSHKMISGELSRTYKLVEQIYPGFQSACDDIFAGAIAQYLDDRFRVTNRRLLGW